MKVSLNWLLEFVDLPTRDVAELTRALAFLGHEVEGVETVEVGWTDVVVAHVDEVAPHPNADKVRLCAVSIGGEPIDVVCGAWNFEAGAKVAFAKPGAILPGDFRIGVRTIRGVESHGMICSEKELGLGEDADGILVLEPDAPVGEPLESLLTLPDVVFDLTITTNRPDAMSVYGIARDLAAWYDVELRVPDPAPPTVPGAPDLSVRIEDPEGNPRFHARQVDGVEVRPSPLWMRHRLRLAGVRPISNLVDVTNYVMLELGQPLHVFDMDRLSGDELVVRRATEGERLVTLDGVERTLSEADIVICDADGPTSLAGTMGGEDSEVHDGTTRALIEAASWDPPSIMHTSRRHGLRSEASARFERGVDPQLPPLAARRAAELILETAGGALREEAVDVVTRPFAPTVIRLTTRDVTRILGDGFDSERIAGLLRRLGFGVEGADPLSVTVPSYRPDVTRPIDLVEEVARLADYDTFGERLRPGVGGGLTPEQRLERRIRELLVGLGYTQAITLPFVTTADLAAFDAPPDHEINHTVRVKNPLSDEEAVLRPSLLPGLLRVIRHNRGRGAEAVAVFEQGRVFHDWPWNRDKRVPDQPVRIAFASVGVVGPADLSGRGLTADGLVAAALVRRLAAGLGLRLELHQDAAPGFHPTRTARITADGELVGYVGELHPYTARAFDIEDRVAAGELDLERLLAARRDPEFRPISPYPPADFDLSFEVAADLPAAALAAAIRTGGGELVERVDVFDEFRGGNLALDRKSLAFSVRLRAPDRTLTADEIGEVREAMIRAAAAHDAVLRGSA
ncbi:MAG: phenylalanine--tRNA ligase subunit beta [Actinomycetes bacterium]